MESEKTKFLKGRKVVKSLRIVLKDFESMVRNPKYLWNGRHIKNFTLLPREAWANWLVCVVLQERLERDITFMDDDKGDGFIIDIDKKAIFQTEHVSALDIPLAKKLATGEQRVIDAINLKIKKGSGYAKGKILVVFFDGAGKFYRNRIRESIYGRHDFEAVFCVGLLSCSDKKYSYSVTEFRDSFGNKSITYKVDINENFNDWFISKIMQ